MAIELMRLKHRHEAIALETAARLEAAKDQRGVMQQTLMTLDGNQSRIGLEVTTTLGQVESIKVSQETMARDSLEQHQEVSASLTQLNTNVERIRTSSDSTAASVAELNTHVAQIQTVSNSTAAIVAETSTTVTRADRKVDAVGVKLDTLIENSASHKQEVVTSIEKVKVGIEEKLDSFAKQNSKMVEGVVTEVKIHLNETEKHSDTKFDIIDVKLQEMESNTIVVAQNLGRSLFKGFSQVCTAATESQGLKLITEKTPLMEVPRILLNTLSMSFFQADMDLSEVDLRAPRPANLSPFTEYEVSVMPMSPTNLSLADMSPRSVEAVAVLSDSSAGSMATYKDASDKKF
jgi:hypothetical protein